MPSVTAERKARREGRRGGEEEEEVVVVGSPPLLSVCEREEPVWWDEQRSFIPSAPSIFSPAALWLLERRCHLAPSQKESIFLPLLPFSLSAGCFLFLSNSIFSPKRCSVLSSRGRECCRTTSQTCDAPVPTAIPEK